MPLNDNDIKSELSYAYLHAVASRAGCECQESRRYSDGMGVDARLIAQGSFAAQPALTRVQIEVQLKATSQPLQAIRDRWSYPLEVELYDKLRSTTLPCQLLLVVLVLPRDPEDWLKCSPQALTLKRLAWHAESGCCMNHEEWYSLPNALVARLEPARVQDYVRQTGWRHQPELGQGLSSIFRRPESDLEQISIPLKQGASHYPRYMRDVLVYIAEWEKRPALDLLYELLLPPADLLSFRESGSAVGSIDVPLDHGLSLLIGVRKILLAATCSARHPEVSHPRWSIAEAEPFVRRCRLAQMGHHFAVTVACPLDAISETNGSGEAPFARRVTTLLMRSLHRLAKVLEAGNLDLALHAEPGDPIISSNLCEGLLNMTPEGDGSALTISVSWTKMLPPPEAVGLPSEVRLSAETFDRLEALAARLRPALVET